LPEVEHEAALDRIAKEVGLGPEQRLALGQAQIDEPDGPLGSHLVEHRFTVTGMQCPSCAWLVEHALLEQRGVIEARADFLSDLASIRIDLRQTSREAAVAALDTYGYGARSLVETDPTTNDPERLFLRFAIVAIAAMNAMMLAWVHYAEVVGASSGEWKPLLGGLGAVISVPAVLFCGAPIFRRSLGLLRAKRLGMETLLTLGIVASLGLSLLAFVMPGADFYFEVPTMIVAAALGSRLVERAIRSRGARTVAELLEPRALRARVLAEDGESVSSFVALDELALGDLVLVPVGEDVPADLVVARGTEPVTVSEAVLSGEPTPRVKRAGMVVLSGSRVRSGSLRGEVIAKPEASAHAQVGDQILEVLAGQQQRVSSADRLASRFVLVILATALGTGIVHSVLLGFGAAAWLPAIAVLVVACPCAFSIAAAAALGTAAIRLLREGVLLHEPGALEAAAAVDTVVFDKTGTLTLGDMDVSELKLRGDLEDRELLLGEVLALEARSRHPVAAAVCRHLDALGVETSTVKDIEELPGLGMQGRLETGSTVAVGAAALFDEVDSSLFESVAENQSAVLFGRDDRALGCFLLEDPLKSTAAAAISSLSKLGVEPRLVSGDDERVVATVAEQTAIAEYEGRALPATKAERVATLRAEGRRVAFVGDGVNDGPALVAADVGIAMRHGAGMALESADLLSLRDDPGAAALVISLSRRLRSVTRQNYAWAIGYNALLLPVAAVGWLHPAFAALAMLVSSATVLANAARLLRG